jgi:hypothetical protein
MKPDPAIEEIREIRRAISKKFGDDTRALINHYIELQKRHADRLLKEPATVPSSGKTPDGNEGSA